MKRRSGPSFFTRRLWKLPMWAWIVLAVVLILGIGGGASKTASVQPVAAPANSTQPAAVAPAAEPAPAANSIPLGLSADFGDCKIDVVGATIRTAGSDTYVICEYNWTNNSGENAMFLTELSEQAFQNGVALDSGILLDVDGNLTTQVMPGYGLTVRTVYILSDPAAEITFSVEPLLDLDDAYAPLTFTVNPSGN